MKNLKVGDRIKMGHSVYNLVADFADPGKVYFLRDGGHMLYIPFTVTDLGNITYEEFRQTSYSKDDWTYEDGSPIYPEEITYSIGDRFEHTNGEEYILVQVGIRMCCLVCLDSGNYYSKPVEVDNPGRITVEEFFYICASNDYSFEKIV